jgi:hypothetical protein
MLAISGDRGLHRHDDLHVDQIDGAWGLKKRWLDAGLESHQTAVELRSLHHLKVVVVLAFSLAETVTFPFKNRRDLESAFDWSPPSLYLFSAGDAPWQRPGYTRVEQIDPTVLCGAGATISAFYAEFRSQDTGELCRNLYLAA